MSKQRIFEAHGVDFTGESGNHLIGTCPFTGKENKFYYNKETASWDSKTAGLSGGPPQFLEHIQKMYQEQMTPASLKKLAAHRGLPVEAFQGLGLGWTGSAYSFGVYDAGGKAVDIRTYVLGKRVMSTAGCNTGLWNAEHLGDHPEWDIYICEGEWDAIALRWLMERVGTRGIVVSVPGAGTWKPEWTPWVSGRKVHVLFDADAAGEEGEARLERKLRGSVRELTFVHWPEGVNDGFDVRDYILYGAIERNTPEECWKALVRKFEKFPRAGHHEDRSKGPVGASEAKLPSKWDKKPPTYEDVVATFKKWLYLETTIGIELALAVVASQQIEGPPVWLFLVAPPGGGKTEMLTSLAGMEGIYLQSSLTPHALISGANWRGDQDPSLIPRLNGQVLVIKDFTSILSMRDAEKDEIFGILRDAYDGRCGKVFGTGIERNYESRFTVLAAVTPRIYDLSQQHHSLGERFLKCGVGNNLQHSSERDIIRRAIDNINSDSKMKHELADVVHAFMKRTRNRELPTLSPDMYERLISLAMWGARLRGTVSHDTYNHEILTSKPSAEVGSRLGIQLAKLAKSIAWIHGRATVTMSDYTVVRKVMVDTISQRTEDVVRILHKSCPTPDITLTTMEIADATRYPMATVQRILNDLHILDVVSRTGTNYRYHWTLSKYIRECVKKAGLYVTEDEMNRPVRIWIRKLKRRGRPMKVKP